MILTERKRNRIQPVKFDHEKSRAVSLAQDIHIFIKVVVVRKKMPRVNALSIWRYYSQFDAVENTPGEVNVAASTPVNSLVADGSAAESRSEPVPMFFSTSISR